MHRHIFKPIYPKVVAEFQKGTRETFLAVGDYEQCDCGQGLFVPKSKDLNSVFCELTKMSERSIADVSV